MRDPFEVYTSLTRSEKPKSLDFEESAADTQSFVEGVHDSDRSAPGFWWLWLFLICCFLLLTGRIFYLQIIRGSEFRVLSENNRVRSQTILAPRGIIYDRNKQILAQNTASFNLVAVPFDLPKQGLEEEIQKLSQVLGLDQTEIQDKLKNLDSRSVNPIEIKQDLSPDQSILFQTKAVELPGFLVQNIPIREYLDPEAFSHVIGYSGLLSPDETKENNSTDYGSVDFIGKYGIEQQYEKYLHGVNGKNLIEVDATGKLLDVLGENNPEPGNGLVLNIDKDLQNQLYQSLSASGGTKIKAAAVAIDPRNGQVLALLSMPGFNNNLFAHGIKTADYNELLNDKNLPLFNRFLAGTYPPGSTVKPMVATAALQEGVITQDTIVRDNGNLVVPNQFNPSLAYNFYGWNRAGLGPMNVRSAIAMSSDIFFYTVAGGYPNTQVPNGLGAEKLAEWYRKFNLGKPTGIDSRGEKSGLVPDPTWKAEYYKKDPILSKWYLGDTYHIGIGQGDLLVTPLQVAEWTAAIANNGTAYKPQIVRQVVDQDGKTVFENKPEVLFSNIASLENLKIVQQGMRQTVTSGTAKPLNSLSITSAGKTGTSQFDGADPTRTHAWFTAYAPYENPQIVITVLVEAGGEGHAVAEPVVRDALKWWSENRYGK